MSSEEKPNAIFISFDDAYFHYAKSCLHSLMQNYPDHPEILIDYQGNSDQVIQYLSNIPRSRLIEVNEYQHFDLGIIQKPIIYNRFSLWTELFSQYNKILHLDVDTLVLQPLSEIFSYKGFWIASDHHSDAHVFLKDDNLFYKSFQIDTDSDLDEKLMQDGVEVSSNKIPMGNAGVFLIPSEYRTPFHYKQLLNIAERYHKHCTYADQSIISLWCFFNRISIHSKFRFNCQVRFLCVNGLIDIQDAAIVHFTGLSKSSDYYNSLNETHKNVYELLHQLRQYFRLPRNETTFQNHIISKVNIFQKQILSENIYLLKQHPILGVDKAIKSYLSSHDTGLDLVFCVYCESVDAAGLVSRSGRSKIILVLDSIYYNFDFINSNHELHNLIKISHKVICSDFSLFLSLNKIYSNFIYLPTAIDTACIVPKPKNNKNKVLVVCDIHMRGMLSEFDQLSLAYESFVIDNHFNENLIFTLQNCLVQYEYVIDFTRSLHPWVLVAAKMGIVVFGSIQNDYLRSCFPYTTFHDSRLVSDILYKLDALTNNNLELEFIRDLALARVERFNPANLADKLDVLLNKNSFPREKNLSNNQYFRFSDNISVISGESELSLSKHEFVVFTLVKNGEGYLRQWMQHYINLGAKHFFVVDNMSTDATREILMSLPKVTLFETGLDFRLYENDIRNYIVSRYCHGHWCLSVDIDEFFDFPDSEKISMSQFLEYQNYYGYTAVLSYMQDMIPGSTELSGNFIQDHKFVDNQLTSISHYASLHKVYCKYNRFNPDTRFCFGGVRSHCFGGDKSQTLLLKHSLTFQDGELEPHTDPHFCDKAKISDVGSVLLHYKFTDFFSPVIVERANNDVFNYYSRLHYQSYERYLKSHAINESHFVSPYEGVQSLVDSGFINVPQKYKIHVQHLTQSPSMKNPLISCLCVTSNRSTKLRKAIACFFAQTYVEKELVVLCDAKDQSTLELLNEIASDQIKVFIQPEMNRLPIGQLRNIAISKASGDYVCTWDDDDWYNVDRLEIQYAALRRHQKPACLLTKIFILDSVNDASYLAYPRLWENSLLVSRSFLLDNQILYPAVRMGEDYVLVDKLVAANAVYPLEEPMLYIYRVSGQNTWPMEHFNHVTKKCQRLTEYQHIVLKKAFEEGVTPEDASRKIYSNYFLSNICYVEATDEPRP